MQHGHGDDIHAYPDIRLNFSSNVYNHFDHSALFAYLTTQLPLLGNYPEPTPSRLEQALAKRLQLTPPQVMATSGATEAIYLVAQAFGGSRSYILGPTFSEYADACRIHAHRTATLTPHTPAEALEALAAIPRQPQGETPALCWLCNPNNPTGTVLERKGLLQLVQRRPDLLFVVDASYAPFTAEPLLQPAHAAGLPNVVMLHSMTKRFAIPGLRLGFVTAHAGLLERLRALQMPWSVNSLAQAAGHYLLAHVADYHLPLQQLLNERTRVAEALAQLGVGVHPSDTHILLCQCPCGTAAWLKDRLAHDHGILIRDASNFSGLTQAHFRIAVQQPTENDRLLAAIAHLLNPLEP